MKRNIYPKILTVIFLMLAAIIAAAAQQPKTVTDFYLAMPEKSSDIANLSEDWQDGFAFKLPSDNPSGSITKYRRSLIKTEDLANGYLRIESKDWQGWNEIALFKKSDGTYLVAVSRADCGPSCTGDVIFLSYKGGAWRDVTTEVFQPAQVKTAAYYKLPRVGTNIELVCGEDSDEGCKNGKTLAVYKWNKVKFVK